MAARQLICRLLRAPHHIDHTSTRIQPKYQKQVAGSEQKQIANERDNLKPIFYVCFDVLPFFL